jgi:hypothetical protein
MVGVDLATILPETVTPLRQASTDLDGDGQMELVVLGGFGGGANRLGYDWLELFVIEPDRPDYPVAWQYRTIGDRGEALEIRDVNDDGLPEVLSMQSMGASGQMLYIVAWRGEAFDLLRPQGGHFGGQEYFGEQGVGIEDMNEDGTPEILAAYGPAAAKIDIYRWNGQAYAYDQTRDYEALYRDRAGGQYETEQPTPVGDATE